MARTNMDLFIAPPLELAQSCRVIDRRPRHLDRMLASLACAPEVACRCWAGRVALRNCARQHRRASPRRSEVAEKNRSKLTRSGGSGGINVPPRGGRTGVLRRSAFATSMRRPRRSLKRFAKRWPHLPTPPSRSSSVTRRSSPPTFSPTPSARNRSRTRPRAPTIRSATPRRARSRCS